MQLDVIILFFILGVIAKLTGSGLRLPAGLHQGITIFLMLAIGLKVVLLLRITFLLKYWCNQFY